MRATVTLASEIVPGRITHCATLLREMRWQQLNTFGGHTAARKSLHESYTNSTERMSWVVDGRLYATGGVISSMLGLTGFIWFVASHEATKRPHMLFRKAKRVLTLANARHPILFATVAAGDPSAIRFARALGFKDVDDEISRSLRDEHNLLWLRRDRER